MMNIEWNKVTWYSKLAAVIIFVATFWLGFYLGTMKAEKIYVEVPHMVNRESRTTAIQPTTSQAITSPQALIQTEKSDATSPHRDCNEAYFQSKSFSEASLYGTATTSPSGKYALFYNYFGFCVKDSKLNTYKLHGAILPKGWAYGSFSPDETLLYYSTGFFEADGRDSEKELMRQAALGGYGLYRLNLQTGENTLIEPWSL